MKKTSRKAPARGEAWATLTGRHANGKPQPTIGDTLPRAQVKTIPVVFQVRDPNEADSANHIAELAAAIKAQGSVDPISVWWSGAAWVCVDGHHRLRAYDEAGVDDIRVKVEHGSPQDMLMLASIENKKNRLHMRATEKAESAWRLTCLPEADRPSKAATVASTGTSDGLVGKQRRIYRELIKDHGFDEHALLDMSWRVALAEHAGRTQPEKGGEAWEEREVEEYCKQLGKTWGTLHVSRLELFLRALQRWDTRLAQRAASEWSLTADPDDDLEP
jgi:hypothetical protein